MKFISRDIYYFQKIGNIRYKYSYFKDCSFKLVQDMVLIKSFWLKST